MVLKSFSSRSPMKCLKSTLTVVTIVKDDTPSLYLTLSSCSHLVDSDIVVVDATFSSYREAICRLFSSELDLPISYNVQRSQGIFEAFNEALELINGDWVIFMNAGDFFVPSSLDKIYGLIKTVPEDSGAIFAKSIVLSQSWKYLGMSPYFWAKSPFFAKLFSMAFPDMLRPCHQSVIFRSFIHKRIRYSHNSIGSDQEVIDFFLSVSAVFSDLAIATVTTSGVSSVGPSTFSSLKNQLSSCISLRQYRRLLVITLKYFLNITGASFMVDCLRQFRFKVLYKSLMLIMVCFDWLFCSAADCFLVRISKPGVRLPWLER